MLNLNCLGRLIDIAHPELHNQGGLTKCCICDGYSAASSTDGTILSLADDTLAVLAICEDCLPRRSAAGFWPKG